MGEEEHHTANPQEVQGDNQEVPKLFKRRQRTTHWDEVSVELKGTTVEYTKGNDKKTLKTLEISGSTVADVEDISEYPHAFSVKPKGSSRTYLFATTSGESKLKILNSICDMQFKPSGKSSHSSACLIQ